MGIIYIANFNDSDHFLSLLSWLQDRRYQIQLYSSTHTKVETSRVISCFVSSIHTLKSSESFPKKFVKVLTTAFPTLRFSAQL